MADENRFFRILWRFNAVVFALLGVIGVCLGAVLGFTWLTWAPFHFAPHGRFAPVPKEAQLNETYRLQAESSPITIGHETVIALRRWNGRPERYGLADQRIGSGDDLFEPDVVNLLAVDTDSGASHWLFRGYRRAIIAQDVVGAPSSRSIVSPLDVPATQATAAAARALVIDTVDADTNGDGRLTGKDRHSLYVYRPGDAAPAKLLDADYVLSMEATADDRYVVVYEAGSAAMAATFDLPSFKPRAVHRLPTVPQ